jgi:hypothetical protein
LTAALRVLGKRLVVVGVVDAPADNAGAARAAYTERHMLQ